MDELRLARDVLDRQLVDEEGRRMGKVDGVVLVVRTDGPPRVTAIETGAVTLAGRFSPRWAERVARWRTRLGLPEGTVRISVARIARLGVEVQAALDARRTAAFAFERWLRDAVIARIPGGKEPGAK